MLYGAWDRVCVDTAEEGALGCDGDRTPTGVGRLHCVYVCVCVRHRPVVDCVGFVGYREGTVGAPWGPALAVFCLSTLFCKCCKPSLTSSPSGLRQPH